jgi:hypothetical protein
MLIRIRRGWGTLPGRGCSRAGVGACGRRPGRSRPRSQSGSARHARTLDVAQHQCKGLRGGCGLAVPARTGGGECAAGLASSGEEQPAGDDGVCIPGRGTRGFL